MLRHLRIGNVRDNRFHHRDGTNREVYQEQILGANPVNNPIHGALSNNQQDGILKFLPSNNRPQGGAHKTQLLNNLPGGTLQVPQVRGDNNHGTHHLLSLMHGLSLNRVLHHGVSKVSNLLHLHRTEVVAVQVNRGHNLHK